MAALAAAGAVLQMADARDQGDKAEKLGRMGREQKEFEARQLDQQAGQVFAASQRDMLDERKRTELIASRALAIAAAGGGAADVSAVNIIADIRGEGAYREALAIYKGEEEAQRLREAARLTRKEGKTIEKGGLDQKRAYNTQAISYGVKGAGSMYERYNTRRTTKTPASGTSLHSAEE